jgi:hypothetical protein
LKACQAAISIIPGSQHPMHGEPGKSALIQSKRALNIPRDKFDTPKTDTKFVPNYSLFDFFYSKFDHSSY